MIRSNRFCLNSDQVFVKIERFDIYSWGKRRLTSKNIAYKVARLRKKVNKTQEQRTEGRQEVRKMIHHSVNFIIGLRWNSSNVAFLRYFQSALFFFVVIKR